MTDTVARQYDAEHYPTSLTTLAQMFNARARSAEQRAEQNPRDDDRDPAAAEAATWRHAEGLVRAHAYYLASRIRAGQPTAYTIDPDQDAALARVTEERDHLAGEINRLADFILAQLPHEIRGDLDPSAVGIAIRLLAPLTDGKSAYVNREEFDHACQQIAAMHAAAVGEVRGPIRGVVEDVADLRADRDRLAAALWVLTQAADQYVLGRHDGEPLTGDALDEARRQFARAIDSAWSVLRERVQSVPVPIDVPDELDDEPGDPDHIVDGAIDAAVNGLVDAFRPLLVSLWRGGLAVGRASAAEAPTTAGADR